MKIEIFDVIKEGIILSFKDKKILTLIILWAIWGIIYTALIELLIIKPRGLNEVAYPPVLPAFGINEGLVFFALFVVSFIIFYAIIKASFENLNKREISISGAIVSVFKKFIPIFIATIIYAIVVIIGLVALIIPGIFLSVALFFYGHAILLNNKGIITSFKESRHIIKGNWWQVFALYLIIIIASILLGFLFGFLAFVFFLFPYLANIINIIYMIVIYFISGMMMVVYTIVYFQLIEKEKKIGVENSEVIQEKRQRKK